MAHSLVNYRQVLKQIGNGRSHLLLGNGFSVACDEIFKYGSLYKRAVEKGLSPRAQSVFGYIGTNNFEAVMKLLGDADWIANTYGLVQDKPSELLKDLEVIKDTLVEVVAKSHPEHTGAISNQKKSSASKFVGTYHNIFTLNYDLLLCWINMALGNPIH